MKLSETRKNELSTMLSYLGLYSAAHEDIRNEVISISNFVANHSNVSPSVYQELVDSLCKEIGKKAVFMASNKMPIYIPVGGYSKQAPKYIVKAFEGVGMAVPLYLPRNEIRIMKTSKTIC